MSAGPFDVWEQVAAFGPGTAWRMVVPGGWIYAVECREYDPNNPNPHAPVHLSRSLVFVPAYQGHPVVPFCAMCGGSGVHHRDCTAGQSSPQVDE